MNHVPTPSPSTEAATISYKQELARKAIHLCSLTIPIVYSFIERETALFILLILFVIALTLDLARYKVPAIKRFINEVFGRMMRAHELDEEKIQLSGATYVLMSAVLCVLMFPKVIGITAFAVLIISDVCSALVGRKFGTIRFLDKSLQGTVAFVVSGWCVVAVIGTLAQAPMAYWIVGAIACAVGGIIEAASVRLRMDDNFSIPLSIGFVMWGLLLLLPSAIQHTVLHLLAA
jgi:dolichol kinase